MYRKIKNQAGFSHILLPLIIILLVIGVSGFAYTRMKNKNTENKPDASAQAAKDQAALEAKLAAGGSVEEWKIQCSGQGPVMMTHTPMDVKDVSLIEPMGLLAAAHVTPIDHLYFYSKGTTKRDANPVYAMADGYIVYNELKERGQTPDKNGSVPTGALTIGVQYNCSTYSYYDLMTNLDPAIVAKLQNGEKHIPIKAGQIIGRVGGQSLDVAIFNFDQKLTGFVNPGTYSGEPRKIYVADFFKYYTGTNLSSMLALNPRKVEPYGGKIDYDIAGKLRGNWFAVGTNGYGGPKDLQRTNSIGDTGYFSGHFSIAPDAVYVNKLNLSFGDYQGKPQQFTALSSSPDPANVDASSGIVKYELTPYAQPTLSPVAANTTVKGVALLQITDGGKHLKMEAFPGKNASQVSGFTSAAKIYER